MAAYLQWRRFVFFDKELVKEPLGSDGAAPGAAPASGSTASKFFCLPPGITVCDSGRGSLVFGDILPLELSLPSPIPKEIQLGCSLSVSVGSCFGHFSLAGNPDLFWGLREKRRKFNLLTCQVSSPGQVISPLWTLITLCKCKGV
jgi:hypothetical protein